MDIRWEEPPTASRVGRANPKEVAVAAELREHPDTWARVQDFTDDDQPQAAAVATQINRGKRAAFRTDGEDSGEFEAKSRKIRNTNVTALYLRYASVGNND